jgi:cytidylate kinase
VLRGRAAMLSVFIHAPLEQRVQRIARLHNLDEDSARALIRKTDRSRANYYSYYTDRDWSAAGNYDLSLDAGRLGAERTVRLLAATAALTKGDAAL